MAELLLEVGCEELPASFVRKAYTDLESRLAQGLKDANLLEPGARLTSLGTPRRLIVMAPGVVPRQEDQKKEQRGPAIQAAYDKDGKPTPAAQGFCRGLGIDPSELRSDGQYVWGVKSIAGREAKDIVAEIVPDAIRGLNFEKSMRWGKARLRFARPIRWLLCLLDGQVVEFDIEGVRTNSVSYGHRFYAPEPFEVRDFQSLLVGLVERKVQPDPAKREERIRAQAAVAATAGDPDLAEALVAENVFLTEWPDAISGNFRAEFMMLPAPVLVTAMAKHEKMFPVRDSQGRITDQFVFVRNSGEPETVRSGAEWVLNARFNDAKFFFDEDGKHSMDWFLERTAGMVFQEKLGSVRSRADRLSALAVAQAETEGADAQEVSYARMAGLYAKADLSSGLVSELASLQGIVGGEYGRRQDFPHEVCAAIAKHYDLNAIPQKDCPGARTALRLLVADQIDKLAGYLGLGLAPSGSSDPYGLRRAATLLIQAACRESAPSYNYRSLFDLAIGGYRQQGVRLDGEKAFDALQELFVSRYDSLCDSTRHDVLAAAVMADRPGAPLAPKAVSFRIQAMELALEKSELVQTCTRPLNIVAAAAKKGIGMGENGALDPAVLVSQSGVDLYDALASVRRPGADPEQGELLAKGPASLIADIGGLAKPINDFFETTMIMVEDVPTRTARLALLADVSKYLLLAGDFSKLQTS